MKKTVVSLIAILAFAMFTVSSKAEDCGYHSGDGVMITECGCRALGCVGSRVYKYWNFCGGSCPPDEICYYNYWEEMEWITLMNEVWYECVGICPYGKVEGCAEINPIYTYNIFYYYPCECYSS